MYHAPLKDVLCLKVCKVKVLVEAKCTVLNRIFNYLNLYQISTDFSLAILIKSCDPLLTITITLRIEKKLLRKVEVFCTFRPSFLYRPGVW